VSSLKLEITPQPLILNLPEQSWPPELLVEALAEDIKASIQLAKSLQGWQRASNNSELPAAAREVIKQALTGPVSTVWQTLADGTRILVDEITAQIDRTRLILVNLSEAQQSAYQRVPGPVMLTEDDQKVDWIETLKLEDPEQGFTLTLAVNPVQADRGTVKISVMATEPIQRAWISLYEDETLLEASLTAEDGTVTFSELAPGQYTFQVKHGQQVWELPFRLQARPTEAQSPL
jgi:hypothetical protein